MLDRRYFLAGCALLAATPLPAFAAGPLPFDARAFETAQKAGKRILLEVSAPWCPTCQAQKPILESLFVDPAYKDLVAFEVDFDTRKDVLKVFNVRMQSTLIVFKGAKEVGRSVGDTNAASITALLAKST